MAELRHFLRKQEFPVCSREALLRLEKLCLSISPQQQRVIQEVIEEFVFCESNRRAVKKNRLNAVQELQLLDVLSAYFVSRESVVLRNTVFLTLFPSEGVSAGNRMRALSKLVSTAVATKCVAVLDCTSVWMQQHGCTSGAVLNLAHELVRDFLLLFPNALPCLLQLPQISAAFTAHFITAVTASYKHEGVKPGTGGTTTSLLPPLPLLRCVTHWVTSDPLLCSTPLIVNLQSCLPKGSIVMPAGVPTVGLIRWCVESPLHSHSRESEATRGDEQEEKEKEKEKEKEEEETRALYSRLHLAVLQAMLEAEKLRERLVQKDVILMRDFTAVCDGVAAAVVARAGGGLGGGGGGEDVQLALDRLGQVLEVALKTRCLRGNLDELRAHLMRLPQNRLLQIIVNHSLCNV